jgi:hypothetical protein
MAAGMVAGRRTTDMHWSGYLTYFIVAFWLLPGAMMEAFIKRLVGPTALVLLMAWGYGEVVAQVTGNTFPTAYYYAVDFMCIMLIATWATGRDYWIMCLYVPEWFEYQNPNRTAGWFACTALTIAQFVIAGPWPALGRNRTREGRRGLAKGAYS